MPINVEAQEWHLAYFVPKVGYFGHIFKDNDFKFVFLSININIDRQTKLKVSWTQNEYFNPRKPQQWPYLKSCNFGYNRYFSMIFFQLLEDLIPEKLIDSDF